MKNNVIETILGAVVLIVAGLFISFAVSTADLNKVKGYSVTANFSNIDGITEGQDVRISGVNIGSVEKIALDEVTYLANVTLSIDPSVELPTDTVAKVSSEGLLGGKYMSLEPGGAEEIIKEGERIEYTQSSVNLEEMIGKFIFSGAENAGEADKKKPAPSADPFSADM
jgi:phospholipid/cholesterol/gamma-HCH transport system substrate-binding protein